MNQLLVLWVIQMTPAVLAQKERKRKNHLPFFDSAQSVGRGLRPDRLFPCEINFEWKESERKKCLTNECVVFFFFFSFFVSSLNVQSSPKVHLYAFYLPLKAFCGLTRMIFKKNNFCVVVQFSKGNFKDVTVEVLLCPSIVPLIY